MDPIKARDQQYFPTYHLSEEASEVALKEYELAASTLATEERILNMSTSVLVGLIGIAAAFYRDNPNLIINSLHSGFGTPGILAFGIVFTLVTFATTSYFADTRRSVVLAGRKIIILRRMLGLNYGHIELVLPNRRIEGANEPYHLSMFHGWLSPKAIPIHCISTTSGLIVWLLFPLTHFSTITNHMTHWHWIPLTVCMAWSLGISFYYRIHLLDQHETVTRLFTMLLAKILRQELVSDFEYVIYRARLAVIEARRLGMPLEKFHPMLIELEDRNFETHIGVSPQAILAAIYRYFRKGKRSGGSTITQQLARSLFIKHINLSFRRKIIEIVLALWLDRQFKKSEIADLYICAVRYETGIIGIMEAMSYFFPKQNIDKIDKSKIFFLLERISNIRSKLIVNKVSENLKYLKKKNILDNNTINITLNLFREQIKAGRLDACPADVEILKRLVSST